MNQSRRFLVIGSDGLIGRALTSRLKSNGAEVFETTRRNEAVSSHRFHLDLDRSPVVWAPPADLLRADSPPELSLTSIFCAAVTNQEKCRQNPGVTAQVNVEQTLRLAEDLGRAGSAIIFLSTNLVFDGATPMVKPADATNPKTEYGRQKMLVEKSLLQGSFGSKCSVVRLGKVFHAAMPLLAKWATDLKAGRTIFPLNDLVCAPIPADFVTEALARLADYPSPGIFQVSADRDVSYAEIAVRLAQLLRVDAKLVQPKSTIELGLNLEHLPAHTTMDASRMVDELGLTPPSVWSTLDSVLSDVIAQ